MADTQISVQLYDPSVDNEPYYETYTIEYTPYMSVLEGLRYILDELKAPISFDYSCRGTGCGLCGMVIDGTAALACSTPLQESKETTVEPLAGYPIIKDLIVDRAAVDERIQSVMPQFMRSTPMKNPAIMGSESAMITGVLQQCRDCGLCMSVCPVLRTVGSEEYAGPEIMVKIATRYFDDREDAKELRLRTAVQQGLFNCALCGTCTTVCPRGEILKEEGFPYSFIDHVLIHGKMIEDAKAAGLEPVEEELVRPVSAR